MEKRIEGFRRWVFWTGVFNIVMYSALILPWTLALFLELSGAISEAAGLGGTPLVMPDNINMQVMIHLVGIIVTVIGIVLILASKRIIDRAWFVFWEGIVRIAVFVLFLAFVMLADAAQILMVFGGLDLIIGGIYVYYCLSIPEVKVV